MDRKQHIDAFGATSLILFAALLAFNQVVIKVTNGGFSPVFVAAIRSAIAVFALGGWMALRGIRFERRRDIVVAGVFSGVLFSFEFICLYIALDLTDVSRASVIFYSMPVWLALAAHVFLPGERLSLRRMLGLALAMTGVAVALMDRAGGAANIWGDLAALGAAWGWAAIALMIRIKPLKTIPPEAQLMWQILVSAVILSAVAPLFGPLLRDPEIIHVAGILFQSLGVVAIGYVFWFWLLTIYPASSVASFSFLSPVLSVLFGWWLLGESVGVSIWAALGLVVLGLMLINRK
ncbi:DMT family transporter [uncultured Shimia sp.]|uniref:DMT family transporter n=1 Tax=uncultured Shimia sp. TaxID=573152 RepID=UPI002604E4CE|nr:DMT family transporter [uncultured Shimia sp.]